MEDETLTKKIIGCAMACLQFKRKSRTYSPKAKIMNTMDGTSAAGGSTNPV